MCPRTALTPRWDNAADVGNKLRVTAYICDICGRTLDREEGERLMAESLEHATAPEV